MPYIGRQGNQKNVGFSPNYGEFFSKPLLFSVVNLTSDIINLPVPSFLLKYPKKNHFLRNDDKKQQTFYSQFTTGKTRRVVSSYVVWLDDRQTLVLYAPKKNGDVILIKTMHNDYKIDHGTDFSEKILNYIATK